MSKSKWSLQYVRGGPLVCVFQLWDIVQGSAVWAINLQAELLPWALAVLKCGRAICSQRARHRESRASLTTHGRSNLSSIRPQSQNRSTSNWQTALKNELKLLYNVNRWHLFARLLVHLKWNVPRWSFSAVCDSFPLSALTSDISTVSGNVGSQPPPLVTAAVLPCQGVSVALIHSLLVAE